MLFLCLPISLQMCIRDSNQGRNNGRVYLAIAHSLGELPKSEMGRIELFNEVPENYTYNRENEINDLVNVEKIWKAYRE